jgi:hypothetical protein
MPSPFSEASSKGMSLCPASPSTAFAVLAPRSTTLGISYPAQRLPRRHWAQRGLYRKQQVERFSGRAPAVVRGHRYPLFIYCSSGPLHDDDAQAMVHKQRDTMYETKYSKMENTEEASDQRKIEDTTGTAEVRQAGAGTGKGDTSGSARSAFGRRIAMELSQLQGRASRAAESLAIRVRTALEGAAALGAAVLAKGPALGAGWTPLGAFSWQRVEGDGGMEADAVDRARALQRVARRGDVLARLRGAGGGGRGEGGAFGVFTGAAARIEAFFRGGLARQERAFGAINAIQLPPGAMRVLRQVEPAREKQTRRKARAAVRPQTDLRAGSKQSSVPSHMSQAINVQHAHPAPKGAFTRKKERTGAAISANGAGHGLVSPQRMARRRTIPRRAGGRASPPTDVVVAVSPVRETPGQAVAKRSGRGGALAKLTAGGAWRAGAVLASFGLGAVLTGGFPAALAGAAAAAAATLAAASAATAATPSTKLSTRKLPPLRVPGLRRSHAVRQLDGALQFRADRVAGRSAGPAETRAADTQQLRADADFRTENVKLNAERMHSTDALSASAIQRVARIDAGNTVDSVASPDPTSDVVDASAYAVLPSEPAVFSVPVFGTVLSLLDRWAYAVEQLVGRVARRLEAAGWLPMSGNLTSRGASRWRVHRSIVHRSNVNDQ